MASHEAEAFLRKARTELLAVELLIQARLFDVAMARSYYATFHAATALLAERGQHFRRHGQLQAALSLQFVRTGLLDREHHRSLAIGEEKRRIADYQPEPGFTALEARESLRRAREFVAAAEALLAP